MNTSTNGLVRFSGRDNRLSRLTQRRKNRGENLPSQRQANESHNPRQTSISARPETRQGVPLETHEIVVNLIGSTKTEAGLEVHAWLDKNQYEKSKKVSDDRLAEVRIKRNPFHGEWNDQILPCGGLKSVTYCFASPYLANTVQIHSRILAREPLSTVLEITAH